MTQWPDFETEDRRLTLKLRLWVGLIGAVLGVLTLVTGLVVDGSVSILAVVGIVVGIPMAVIARRQMRTPKSSQK